VRYLETVALLNAAPPAPAAATAAVRIPAVELCSAILDQLWRLSFPYPKRAQTRDRRAFLRGVLPSALVLLASALQLEPRRSGLAQAPLTRRVLRKRLHAFAKAPTATTEFDEQVTHLSLIAFVVKTLPLNPDALYNRACYHTRAAAGLPAADPAWKSVEQQLHEAIWRGGPALAANAQQDPALADFCDDPGRAQRLEEAAAEIASCALGTP
jgi:hypothetical protein